MGDEMIQVVICDDETRILVKMKEEIEQIFQEQGAEADYHLFDSCEQLLLQYDQMQMDVLFLDIDMPGMSGFELARQLCNRSCKACLVFVTNQDALVYESFTFHPFAFVRKAYFEQEIEQVIRQVLSHLRKMTDYHLFMIGNERMKLPLCQILYLEAEGNYVKLIMIHKEYRIRKTLTVMEQELEPFGFIRIHKGFLVNQEAILAIRQNEVELVNYTLLPIGRTNKEQVKRKLMQYLR